MNILVDENIPRQTVAALRALGHSVTDLRGTPEQGSNDDVIWQRACRDRALLVTTDKAFATRWQEPHWGVLIIRLRQPNWHKIHERVLEALRQFPAANWPGRLVVRRDFVQNLRRGPLPSS